MVDSGVDANPQFGDRVIPGPDLVAGTKPGIPPGADCVGHGTAVASIIAAAPVPGVSFTGVAPAARILSVKISGTDTFPTSVTPQGIMDAVQFGADVINLSLATPDDVPALRNAVEYALRHNVVVVAAAGNDLPQRTEAPARSTPPPTRVCSRSARSSPAASWPASPTGAPRWGSRRPA